MYYTTLSNTDLNVSTICLGTMGYGRQVTEADAFKQMDTAIERGVNFFDTAEMYPVPPDMEFAGRTEEIIGRWLRQSGKRKEIVLATKVSGPGRYRVDHHLRKDCIETCVDASLKRLQTDVVDLYQLHWPDRNVQMFGVRGYKHSEDEVMTPIAETLKALDDMITSGKIRHVGLSNETPWGTMEFLRLSKELGLPRMVSVQNVYSVINRHYDIGMAEVSMRENIGLLAYSPLGYGILGGHYFDGFPKGSRPDVHPEFAVRYRSPAMLKIAEEYAALGKKYDLTLAQLSLAFVRQQPFVTSTIIGASTLQQLEEDIGSVDVILTEEVLSSIDALHEKYPNRVA